MFKIAMGLVIVLFIGYLILGVVIKEACEDECKSKCVGELYSEIKSGGGYSCDKDICICYHRDKTETFLLGEK